MDGAPVMVVRAEHLANHRLRFWLEVDGQRRELCTLDGVSRCYPVVKKAVQDLLQLPDDYFIVSLDIPRPPYVHDGQIVLVTEAERSYRAVVRGWFDSAVLVDPLDPVADGGGLYAPERLTYDIDDPGPRGVPYDAP